MKLAEREREKIVIYMYYLLCIANNNMAVISKEKQGRPVILILRDVKKKGEGDFIQQVIEL